MKISVMWIRTKRRTRELRNFIGRLLRDVLVVAAGIVLAIVAVGYLP